MGPTEPKTKLSYFFRGPAKSAIKSRILLILVIAIATFAILIMLHDNALIRDKYNKRTLEMGKFDTGRFIIDESMKKGVEFMQMGRYEEALEEFDATIETRGGFDSWNNRGTALYMMGRYDEAAESFRRAILINPYPEAYVSLADSLVKSGKNKEALEAYLFAVNESSDLIMAYNNLGGLFASMGRYEEAIDAFDKSLALVPHIETVLNKADALEMIGRKTEAENLRKTAHEVNHSIYEGFHVHTTDELLHTSNDSFKHEGKN